MAENITYSKWQGIDDPVTGIKDACYVRYVYSNGECIKIEYSFINPEFWDLLTIPDDSFGISDEKYNVQFKIVNP